MYFSSFKKKILNDVKSGFSSSFFSINRSSLKLRWCIARKSFLLWKSGVASLLRKMEKQIEGSNQKVMVIIDESEYSYHALMWVLDNLKGFITDSPLVMFAALPTPNCNFAYGAQLGTTALYCTVSPS